MGRDTHRVLGENVPLAMLGGVVGLGVALSLTALSLSLPSRTEASSNAVSSNAVSSSNEPPRALVAPEVVQLVSAHGANVGAPSVLHVGTPSSSPTVGANEATEPSEPERSHDAPRATTDACHEPLIVSFERADREPAAHELARARAFARWAAPRDERLVVRGHTDDVGNEYHNLQLSHRRARRVAELLRLHGVREDRIVVQGVGEYQPRTEPGGHDRRVEVLVLGPCTGAHP